MNRRWQRGAAWFALVLVVLRGGAPLSAQSARVPTIAAAADLNAALPGIVAAFTKATGQTVTPVYGSSGTFTQQILNGAPFELFLSADEQYVHTLVHRGKTDGVGALYATGRIGLFIPRGSRITADSTLQGFVTAVQRGDVARLAMANPEHAPYGRAAREALQQLGIWQALEPRLVLGENAAQATQFAMSGNVQAGIIPLSLARTPSVQAAGMFVLIGADRHTPLRQRMVLLKGAGPAARAFYAFLQTREARRTLEQFGFLLPAQ